MNEHLLGLSDSDLSTIAAAFRARRLAAPFSGLSLQRLTGTIVAEAVAGDLQHLAEQGFAGEQLAAALELLIADRAGRPAPAEVVDLVTTGPEAPGVVNRDTSVVVRELFANAQDSVLVAGYAVYQGQNVFRALADRMVERPLLKVRMFLDVQRGAGDTSAATEIVRRFVDRFKTRQWPADRPLPEIYFDPRSLAPTAAERACLHAKCVVVDREIVFISSANFTEAAQERNLEMGLVVRLPSLAEQVAHHFDVLLAAKKLHRVL